MTQFDDTLKQGRAYYARAITWTPDNQYANQYPSADRSVDATESRGVPHTQMISYEVGAASTALASGVFFSSATQPGGTLTATGILVTASVATFDVPRSIAITASTDNSTSVFTVRGTDGYGQALTWSGIGPTGNTLGNNGSFIISSAAFKTITSASMVGSSTGGLQIGTSNQFGLPFRVANTGKMLVINVNGVPVATGLASTTAVVNAGFAATGTHTASGADVRGTFLLPTTNQANGTKFITCMFIAPTVGVAETADSKENSYGLTPNNS